MRGSRVQGFKGSEVQGCPQLAIVVKIVFSLAYHAVSAGEIGTEISGLINITITIRRIQPCWVSNVLQKHRQNAGRSAAGGETQQSLVKLNPTYKIEN
ncbi:hypothetical protein D1AOALGA4SA_6019 [Olavius algarvensis Delta 1 endosymbiont]|nr:hypothetical protein D1AOALGA4SA_6019 [Olavius algarvensis Delta 1 endosymbiont]